MAARFWVSGVIGGADEEKRKILQKVTKVTKAKTEKNSPRITRTCRAGAVSRRRMARIAEKRKRI